MTKHKQQDTKVKKQKEQVQYGVRFVLPYYIYKEYPWEIFEQEDNLISVMF